MGDGGKGKGKGKGKNGGGGAVPVVVAKSTLKNVPIEISVVGNVEAYSVVTVRAQTGGMLTKVNFQEGDYVKKDDVLFLIDRKPLEGQMKSAVANLAEEHGSGAPGGSQPDSRYGQRKVRPRAGRALPQAGVNEGIFAKEQGEQLKSNADAQAQLLEADRAAINSAKAQMESRPVGHQQSEHSARLHHRRRRPSMAAPATSRKRPATSSPPTPRTWPPSTRWNRST